MAMYLHKGHHLGDMSECCSSNNDDDDNSELAILFVLCVFWGVICVCVFVCESK